MTEFETAVAKALSEIPTLPHYDGGTLCAECLETMIAPRVAAAISAAHGSQGWKAVEHLQQAALKALRGTP